MCTVTFLPLTGNDFIFTSNRDIPYERKKAAIPKQYEEDGVTLVYPKDGKAGGTWIGTSEKQRLLCLLNGGFVNHVPLESYVRSRGLIVKELLKADDLMTAVNGIDLNGVEQFTIVIVDWLKDLKLYEFVWDGSVKHVTALPLEPRIWSSSTLYEPAIKQLRKDWFKAWLSANTFDVGSILRFHHTAGIGDPTIDVMMDRITGGTVSISCVEKRGAQLVFSYEDVTNGQKSQLTYTS
ncbi:NRDE family protein [Flavobacteriaceae bacterium F08102]|nr:NRDE family protein [Flavobacteriaceae bacterium F08102]